MKDLCKHFQEGKCRFGSSCKKKHVSICSLLDPPNWIFTFINDLPLKLHIVSPEEIQYSLRFNDTRRILDDMWVDNYTQMYKYINDLCRKGPIMSTSRRCVDIRKDPQCFNLPFDFEYVEDRILKLRNDFPIVDNFEVLVNEEEDYVDDIDVENAPSFIKEYAYKKEAVEGSKEEEDNINNETPSRTTYNNRDYNNYNRDTNYNNRDTNYNNRNKINYYKDSNYQRDNRYNRDTNNIYQREPYSSNKRESNSFNKRETGNFNNREPYSFNNRETHSFNNREPYSSNNRENRNISDFNKGHYNRQANNNINRQVDNNINRQVDNYNDKRNYNDRDKGNYNDRQPGNYNDRDKRNVNNRQPGNFNNRQVNNFNDRQPGNYNNRDNGISDNNRQAGNYDNRGNRSSDNYKNSTNNRDWNKNTVNNKEDDNSVYKYKNIPYNHRQEE